MPTATVYATSMNGHEIELEFDKSLVVLNKAILRVDGQTVGAEYICYGERALSTRLADGTEVEVAVHSGMVGELTRAQVRTGQGSWLDLDPR
jgi:hypothetical protein